MNYKLYLKRIGVGKTQLPANAETLFYLQQQHLLHVPFENIDIYHNIPITLDAACAYEKIVTRKRGGYCYECNGLFYELLSALGYEVKMISCRVMHRKHTGPEFDHLALLVHLDGYDYLVDAGFGDFSMKPLLLQSGKPVSDGINSYCIAPYGSVDGRQYLSACKWSNAKKRYNPVYLFTTDAYSLEDFAGMHHHHQTSPESHFTRSFICSMPAPQGRVSLINNRLITHDGGEKKEQLLYTSSAIQSALAQYFGLVNTLPVVAG